MQNRLAFLTNKCQGEADMEYYLLEAAHILGLRLPPEPTAKVGACQSSTALNHCLAFATNATPPSTWWMAPDLGAYVVALGEKFVKGRQKCGYSFYSCNKSCWRVQRVHVQIHLCPPCGVVISKAASPSLCLQPKHS